MKIPDSVVAFLRDLNELVLKHDVMIESGHGQLFTVGGYDLESGEPQHEVDVGVRLTSDDGFVVAGATFAFDGEGWERP